MPATHSQAVNFLETQWSSINQNKIKGIVAEVRLKGFLTAHNMYFGPGGWIVIPGKPTPIAAIPTKSKVFLIPRAWTFSWQPQGGSSSSAALSPAEVSAYNYFRQHGIQAYFADPTTPVESNFELPLARAGTRRASYPRSYGIELKQVAISGQLTSVAASIVFNGFPLRTGNLGLRCNSTGRITQTASPWSNPDVVSDLFWFEYVRYYFQVDYLLSNNDLDMYIIGKSGSAFPVELKSKSAAHDEALGDWFGIDMGPFAKLAFFTANGMRTDALYIVEELDASGNFIDWLAIRYTELVKVCSWVGRAGGTGMTGGSSTTYKVPKAAFSPLLDLLPDL